MDMDVLDVARLHDVTVHGSPDLVRHLRIHGNLLAVFAWSSTAAQRSPSSYVERLHNQHAHFFKRGKIRRTQVVSRTSIRRERAAVCGRPGPSSLIRRSQG